MLLHGPFMLTHARRRARHGWFGKGGVTIFRKSEQKLIYEDHVISLSKYIDIVLCWHQLNLGSSLDLTVTFDSICHRC